MVKPAFASCAFCKPLSGASRQAEQGFLCELALGPEKAVLNPALIHSTAPNIASSGQHRRWGEACLGLLLLTVFLINLPAFLCMGLDPDAMQWDLGARTVLTGGVPYRDWVENNLPGMLWLHVLIRSLLGWRSEVLRLVDVLMVLTLIGQLTRWLPGAATRTMRLIQAGVLLIFYLSTSEWCHCQRDVWMLVPALAALSLRLRQMRRLGFAGASPSRIVVSAFAEGVLWGAAFWIKPFVMVPAVLCWLLSSRLAWQTGAARRRIALDGAAVIAGGMACGAAGVGWLAATGAWPAFAEILFVWNRDYLVADETNGNRWLCLGGFVIRFFPWVLVHLLAVPEALGQIGRKAMQYPAQALLAMLYLGWLLQACFLQHIYDYVHVPCFFLGLTILGCRSPSGRPVTRRPLLALLLVCVLMRFPAICVDRLLLWNRCLQEGSTATLRDCLSLLPKANWSDLEEVQAFLHHQRIRDGELSCIHMPAISLYQQLDVKAATRFLFLQNVVLNFKSQRQTIFGELAVSRQHFLICDLQGYGMKRVRRTLNSEEGQDGFSASLPAAPYAWSDRIVFRSGRYIVFRLSGAETARWFEETFTP
jgi:hypothetical protein